MTPNQQVTSNGTPRFPGKLIATEAGRAADGPSVAEREALKSAGRASSGWRGSKAVRSADRASDVAQVIGATRISEPGSDAARQGVSLADTVAMLAQQLQQVMATMQGGSVQPTLVTTAASSVATGFASDSNTAKLPAVQAVPVKPVAARVAVPARSPNAALPPAKPTDRPKGFDPDAHYGLSARLAESNDRKAYIAESTDPQYSRNPFALVGIQWRTMLFTEKQLRQMHEILSAMFEGGK
jgi:hypothetical protein